MAARRARPGLALALAAALAACAPVGGPGQMQVRSVTQRAVLVDAAGTPVRIVPPEGKCVVQDTVETSPDGVFVLLGDCDPGDGTGIPGILTASVSSAALFGPEETPASAFDKLEEFLASPRGLALVGRGGDASALRILESYREGDALLLFVEDRGAQVIPAASPRFWRAFLQVNGRMASLSVGTFLAEPAEDRAMLATLRAFVAAVREANAPGLFDAPAG